MAKLTAILVTIIGILLILPLVGVTEIGTVTEGALAWIIAILVLIVGIGKLIRNFKR